MNREETLALWRTGRDAWNSWAKYMLAERKAIEARGEWAATKDFKGDLKPGNAATRGWLLAARVDFSTHEAPSIFDQDADFSDWIFPGVAVFDKATFAGRAMFRAAKFMGAALFDKATFASDAVFSEAKFIGDSRFNETTFTGAAVFNVATFTGDAWFFAATFTGAAWFGKATFTGDARFDKATFAGDAWIGEATFAGIALFDKATFTGDARFSEAAFAGAAGFSQARFAGGAAFSGATFSGGTGFNGATFSGDARFERSAFLNQVRFTQANFASFTVFDEALFKADTSFAAVDVKRAFSLAGATFHGVPDFIQAHFAEAPRLDNIHVERAMPPEKQTLILRLERLFIRPDTTARWRSLRRLAIQAHDHEREMKFLAGEIRAARGATDFPIHWKLWNGTALAGVSRWWFGWAYDLVSDFGRSLARPFLLWLGVILTFTVYFLGQSPAVHARMEGSLAAQTSIAASAWWEDEACYAPAAPASKTEQYISGLAPGIRAQTSAANEALHLAIRNAFIVLDGGADAAHRTFGCLYGVERYGDNPVAIVPSSVSFAAAIQKTLSALLIFVFGLAVRNMLRMK